MVLLSSQHLLTYPPHSAHTIYATEQHQPVAGGVWGSPEQEAKRALGKAAALPMVGNMNKTILACWERSTDWGLCPC